MVVGPFDVAAALAATRPRRVHAVLGDLPHDPGTEAAIDQLLLAGCKTFVCYGPRCEALHDLVDDILVGDGHRGIEHVMTSWHPGESAAEVAFYLWECTELGDGDVAMLVTPGGDEEMVDAILRAPAEADRDD